MLRSYDGGDETSREECLVSKTRGSKTVIIVPGNPRGSSSPSPRDSASCALYRTQLHRRRFCSFTSGPMSGGSFRPTLSGPNTRTVGPEDPPSACFGALLRTEYALVGRYGVDSACALASNARRALGGSSSCQAARRYRSTASLILPWVSRSSPSIAYPSA